MINAHLLNLIVADEKKKLSQSASKLRNEIQIAQAEAQERDENIRKAKDKHIEFATSISPIVDTLSTTLKNIKIDSNAFQKQQLVFTTDDQNIISMISTVLLEHPVHTTKQTNAATPKYILDKKTRQLTDICWDTPLHDLKSVEVRIHLSKPINIDVVFEKPYALICNLPSTQKHSAWTIDSINNETCLVQRNDDQNLYSTLLSDYQTDSAMKKRQEQMTEILKKYLNTEITPRVQYAFNSLCAMSQSNDVAQSEMEHVFKLAQIGNVITLKAANQPTDIIRAIDDHTDIRNKPLSHAENALHRAGIANAFAMLQPQQVWELFQELRIVWGHAKNTGMSV